LLLQINTKTNAFQKILLVHDGYEQSDRVLEKAIELGSLTLEGTEVMNTLSRINLAVKQAQYHSPFAKAEHLSASTLL
jgi:hypothetical protein